MPLITIHASAPWGPVSLRTAVDIGEVLTWGTRPAATVDVGEQDPANVLREALRLLPAPLDAAGLIPATVEKARNSVTKAVSRVSATHVATGPANAVSGGPGSHGGPVVSGGEAEPAFSGRCACEDDAGRSAHDNIGATNSSTHSPDRCQFGQEVDAKSIRAGLGLSQPAFAKAFGISLATLRDWEQGRTKPEGASRVLLQVIEASPEVVRGVVAAGRSDTISHSTTIECR